MTTPFCLGVPIQGQNVRVGYSGKIPIDTLQSMDDTLLVADRASQSDLLKRLGVDAEIAEGASAVHFSHEIRIQPTVQGSGHLYGILTLPCGTQGQAFLYLLRAADNPKWHVVDQIGLGCFHETPSFEVLSLVAGESSVFVHHVDAGHGTGTVQDRAVLYAIRNGRFRKILSTFDYRSEEVITEDLVPVIQVSTFLEIPGRRIEETRVTSQNGLPRQLDRRLWRWNPMENVFTAGAFVAVHE